MNPAAKIDYSDSWADRLENCYTGAVYDTLRAMGSPDQLLPQTIRPLDPGRVLAGKIFNVSGHVDTTLDPHTTLLEIIAEVTEHVEQVLHTENKVRTAILEGVDPVDAYLQYRKF